MADRIRHGIEPEPPASKSRKLHVDPGAPDVRLAGRNLIEQGRSPTARLDGRPLGLLDATSRSVAFSLPPGHGGGRLTVELPDGSTEQFDLVERREGRR